MKIKLLQGLHKIMFRTSLILVIQGVCYSQLVPANFIFGDSVVEVGNNNYIKSLSRANFLPYGIDFGRPTGRFTNGKTTTDIIGSELGFQNYTPPYLAPTTVWPVILKGVNYASGGGGILNETGAKFGGRMNMDAQLDNFASTRQDLISNIGEPATLELFGKSLFLVTIGSNDLINNYLKPNSMAVDQNMIGADLFVTNVIWRFRLHLTRLHNLGARKIVVVNVGPIGCSPCMRDYYKVTGEDVCAEFANQVAQIFNNQLRSLVDELSSTLIGLKFVYANVYDIVLDMIQNYTPYGFENANSACCYTAGRFGGLVPCSPDSKVCNDRSKYVFWDPFHPTEAANSVIARCLLYSGPPDVFPMNVMQLVQS